MHIFGRQVIWDRIIYSSGDYLDAIQKFDALSFLSSNEDRHVNGQNLKYTTKAVQYLQYQIAFILPQSLFAFAPYR